MSEREAALTVRVAVDAPQHSGLNAPLDYASEQALASGTLVRVPLGRRTVTGVVWDASEQPPMAGYELPALKPVAEVLPVMERRLGMVVNW